MSIKADIILLYDRNNAGNRHKFVSTEDRKLVMKEVETEFLAGRVEVFTEAQHSCILAGMMNNFVRQVSGSMFRPRSRVDDMIV